MHCCVGCSGPDLGDIALVPAGTEALENAHVCVEASTQRGPAFGQLRHPRLRAKTSGTRTTRSCMGAGQWAVQLLAQRSCPAPQQLARLIDGYLALNPNRKTPESAQTRGLMIQRGSGPHNGMHLRPEHAIVREADMAAEGPGKGWPLAANPWTGFAQMRGSADALRTRLLGPRAQICCFRACISESFPELTKFELLRAVVP